MDGSAKIALIAIDRSIAASDSTCMTGDDKKVIDIIDFLDELRQAIEKTFPGTKSFIRPGFDETGPARQGQGGVGPSRLSSRNMRS